MAFNPPVNDLGLPMRVEGEYLVLERKNIEIEVKVDNTSGKKTGKGRLYITTARMVFVADKREPSFSSFDIPFFNIYNEKFEQPIFGANYLYARVKPLFGLLPGDCTVKLWFMSGGCQKFLKYFISILGQIRKRKHEGADPAFVKDLMNGTLDAKFAAYVDPNDPSVVFVSQPELQKPNTDMTNYYAPMQKQLEPKLDTFGTQQKQSPFSGKGIQLGSDMPEYQPQQQQQQQQQNYQYAPVQQYEPQGGMIPNTMQTSPFNTNTTTTNYYPPTSTNTQPTQQNLYPTFSSNQEQQQLNYVPTQQQTTQEQTTTQQQQNLYAPTQQNMQPFDGIQQGQPQQQPLYAPPQPNVGYYFGFWGPKLENNRQQ